MNILMKVFVWMYVFVVCSVALCDPMDSSMPYPSLSLKSLLKFMSVESVMGYLTISSTALVSFCFQSFPDQGLSNELALYIRWPKYWSFNFSISPSSECSGLIFFRIDWSPCCPKDSQESSSAPSKALILQHSAFFIVQFSNPYMTTGKTIALTIWAFVGKMMSLFFNTLSRFVKLSF